MRLFFIPLSLILLCGGIFFFNQHVTKIIYHAVDGQSETLPINPASPHRVLLVCSYEDAGGGELHSLMLYKELLKKGIPTTFLIGHNAALKEMLNKEKLPFYTCNLFRFSLFKHCWQPGLESAIKTLCKQHNFTIVHCNCRRNTIAAKKAVRSMPSVKIVFTNLVMNPIPPHVSKDIDGIIGTSAYLADLSMKEKLKYGLTNQVVTCITPFVDEQKFLGFQPTRTKEDFFKQEFNVTLKPIPLLCMLAHMYQDLDHKNHPLMLKALQKLIVEKKRLIQIAFAGYGPRKKYLQDLAQQYGIQDYCYFIGSTLQTPELLFHSDIEVLTSKNEAFGIVILE